MMTAAMRLALLLPLAVLGAYAEAEESCETPSPQGAKKSASLLQVQAQDAKKQQGKASSSKTCSYHLVEDQDGSQTCGHLEGQTYVSGRDAPLDEAGYTQTAKLCCHHEMSLFVRREIQEQGFDVCELSDLHGFVHWYDCDNDLKTYAEMKKEIAGVMTSNCPWLGKLPNCPYRDPDHCGVVAPCKGFDQGDLIPIGPMQYDYTPWNEYNKGAPETASLDSEGYRMAASRCCRDDMKQYISRVIEQLDFVVCDEGGFTGFVPWFDCKTDDQTYDKLVEGLKIGRSGLPPMCPWLGSKGEACPPQGHNCPVVEVPEPEAHRRRTACR